MITGRKLTTDLAHYTRDVEHLMRLRRRVIEDPNVSGNDKARVLADINRLAKSIELMLGTRIAA